MPPLSNETEMQSKTYLNMLQRGFVRKPVFSRKAETEFQEGARPIHWMEAKQICGTMPIGTAYSMGIIAILSWLRSCRTIRISSSSGTSTGSVTESKGIETHRGFGDEA